MFVGLQNITDILNVFRTGIPNHIMSVLEKVSASDIVKGVGDLPDVWSALVLLPHVR